MPLFCLATWKWNVLTSEIHKRSQSWWVIATESCIFGMYTLFLGNYFWNFHDFKPLKMFLKLFVKDLHVCYDLFLWILHRFGVSIVEFKHKEMTWIVEMSYVMTNKMTNKTKQNEIKVTFVWRQLKTNKQTNKQWKITYVRSLVCQKHGFPWQMQEFSLYFAKIHW